MRGAIAYVRVSTEHQASNGISLDGQMTQIEAFCKEMGFQIRKKFRESGSAMREDVQTRPELRDAILLSRKRGWPIIVASLDRLARNVKTVEEYVLKGRLHVISASNCPGADHVVLRSQAVRAQSEGREIGRRTREGLARAKARGTRLGNTTNLEEAQRKGAEANKRVAAQRARELEKMVNEARGAGAQTAEQIAATVNRLGHRTARGKRWTADNVYRVLRQIEAAKLPADTVKASAGDREEKKVMSNESGLQIIEDSEWGVF